MSKTGGDDIFRFDLAFPGMRALINDSVAEFDGKHFVLTPDDVIVHNGTAWQSIADNKIRDQLFGSIDNSQLRMVQVKTVHHKSEVWIIYPDFTNVDSENALVWNWKSGAWGFKTIPPTRQMCTLRPEDDTNWDAEVRAWTEYPMLASSSNKIYESSTTTNADGSAPTHVWERTGIVLGDWKDDQFLRNVMPHMTSRIPVTVSVGHQRAPNDAVVWDSVKTFDPIDPGQNIEVHCRAPGPYHALRVESSASATSGDGPLWKLYGFTLEHTGQGARGKL
jgi:hypothetical protein